MADFWRGFGGGFAKSYESARERRERKKELKEERDIRAKELADAAKERQEAAREARHARTDERNWLLLQKDADRAYDELKKQDEARRKVAGFDPKIREQVGQAPSLIRSDAPSLPYGKDELGYDHPFKGSPELIEDVARSLKEEKGEVDWLSAVARGTRIQTMADKAKEDARVNREARERAIFADSISAIGISQRQAGENKEEFTPVNPKESGVPIWLQKTNHKYGQSTGSIKVEDNNMRFLSEASKGLLTSSKGLGEWGYRFKKPTTIDEVNEEQAKQSIAEDKKNLFDTQQQVFGSPPNLTPMDKPEIVNLPIGEVNNLTRKWSEALEDQRIKRIGDEEKAKHDATKETPQEEYKRYSILEGLKTEGIKPYYSWRNVKGDWESDPEWIPNFEAWEKETNKKATLEMWNTAKELMGLSGAVIHDPPKKGWRKLLPQQQPTQPPQSDLLDPEVPPARMPREGAGLSDTLRQGLMPPQEPPREVDINTLTDEEVSNIATYPEGKPFKTGSGVWFIRRGFKLIEVEPPLGPVE